MKYFKNSQNKLFINPIVANHSGLVEIQHSEFMVLAHPPIPEKTIQQKIDDLENSITERNKREYSKGINEPTNERFFYSTEKIDGIDAEIVLLRAEL